MEISLPKNGFVIVVMNISVRVPFAVVVELVVAVRVYRKITETKMVEIGEDKENRHDSHAIMTVRTTCHGNPIH